MRCMSTGVRELRVWQEAVALAGEVIRAIRQGVRRETKSVSDSVMATAMAAGSHIADGYARPTSAEQRESYLAAKRTLLRLETELAVARHAELIPAAAFTELTARSNHVARLLTGYLVYLDRQLADGAARPSTPLRGPAAPTTPDSARVPS
jgi:four helix bundle protein